MKPSLVIIDGIRTPFCRAGTSLGDLDAVELGRTAVSALLTKTGIDPHVVDETILGCVGQPAHAQNIARVIALRSGLPESKPAVTVHRNCASGMEAVTTAFDKLAAGHGEVFIVGGVDSMSQMPLYFSRPATEKFSQLGRSKSLGQRLGVMTQFRPADFSPVLGLKLGLTDPVSEMNMGQTAELLAREFRISREAQDAFAMRSHLNAVRAKEQLAREITPVYLKRETVTADNGVRPDSSLEKLAKLPPMFDRRFGSVTAGNSSQITDGAVALLVTSESKAEQMGWKPLGRLVDYAYTGCDPKRMGLGPVRALDALFHRTHAKLSEMDVIEINEAFAAQVLAVVKAVQDRECARRCGLEDPLGELDPAKLNLRGGAIALGHPVGATGARLVLSVLHQLRDNGQRHGVASLCIGGGQGGAVQLEAM